MIVYSAITGASVGAVFMGGVGPGILLGLCFAGWVVVHVYRAKVPSTGAFDFRVVLQRTKSAGWALGMPVLILGGIYSGIFYADRGICYLYDLCYVCRSFSFTGR